MLERVSERYMIAGARVDIYKLPRTKVYACKVTFPGGDVVSSIAERKSFTTVEGAKVWARQAAKEWAEAQTA
jgi:hypothetical protein